MRSRNIRWEYFKSADVGELCGLARHLFVGLWCLSDKRGVVPFNLKWIKAEVHPYDDITTSDVEVFIRQMADLGMVCVYKNEDGECWLRVTGFEKHQVLTTKEKKMGALRGPTESEDGVEIIIGGKKKPSKYGGVITGSLRGQLGDYINLKSEIGNLKGSVRGNDVADAPSSDEVSDSDSDDSAPAGRQAGSAKTKRVAPIGFEDGEFVGITAEDRDRWEKQAPGVDVDLELSRAAGWLVENPKRMKKNLRAFAGGWLRRASDRVIERGGSVAVVSKRPKAWTGFS